MSISVKNAIIDAYKRCGRLSDRTSQTLDSNRLESGLQELNDILQRLNSEEYFPFTIVRYEIPISVSQMTYTLGLSSSDWSTVQRPEKISSIFFKPSPTALAANVIQVSVNDIDNFRVGSLSTGMPRYFSYDAGYPEAIVYFNVMPMTASTIVLTTNNVLPILSIDDVLPTPPEYTDLIKWCLTYNLGIRSGQEVGDIANFEKERNRAMKSIQMKNSSLKKRTWNHRQYGSESNVLCLT